MLRDRGCLGLRDNKLSILRKQEPVCNQPGGGGADFLYIHIMGGITLLDRRPRILGREPLGLGAEKRNEGAQQIA